MMNRWLLVLLLATPVAGGACSGSSKGGSGNDNDEDDVSDNESDETDGDGGTGGTRPPPSTDSLNRNPEHPLVCDPNRSLTMLAKASPMPRLTIREYKNTIADLLGENVDSIVDSFPDDTTLGFSNDVGNQQTSSEQTVAFEKVAFTLAGKAAADSNKLGGCSPTNAAQEESCGKAIIEKFGKRAYRRALTDAERKRLEDFFVAKRTELGSFKDAVEVTVGAILLSPQFMYRMEFGAGDTTRDGRALTSWEMASRLSYFLLNSMPDDELLAAAEKDQVKTTAQIEAQAKRLLNTDRARQMSAEFFSEYLNLPRWRELAKQKDTKVYPGYTLDTANALSDGLEKFIDDSFWADGSTLEQMLTSKDAWVNDKTAAIYGAKASGGGLAKVAVGERRAGLLTQAGLMAGIAHPTEQASIVRGHITLEKIICAPTPPPPQNVDISIPEVPAGQKMTYRQRVVAKVEVGFCAECHLKIDGVGFLYENYDGIGAWQDQEQGLPVDASGKIEGTLDMDGQYDNVLGLIEKMGKSEQVAQCVAEHWYQYAVSRSLFEEDGCSIAAVTDAFVNNKGDWRSLLVAIAKDPEFRRVSTLPFSE